MNWLPKLSILITLLLVSFSAQSSTLIKDATILTLAEGSDKPFTGYILIDEGNITAIEQGVYDGKADTVIDAAGKIIIPGFLSGHSHLWQSAFRGLAADKTLFPWLKALHWTYGDYFSKGDFYTFTLDGALDQLAHGITTTYNHSQRLGASEQDYMESLYASIDSGQHFIFSYNSDLSLSKEELTQHFSALNKQAEQLKKTTSLLAFSVNAVGYYGHKDKFPLELKLAKKYGLTVQIHYLEEYKRRFHDRKAWPFFVESGAADSNVSYAHFIHPDDTILHQAAQAGASMIWNPLSNGRLASGLADIPKYISSGLGVGMGVDGAASADIADPFENMRMGMYALRMQHKNPDVMLPIEILRLHTLKTAQVLNVDQQVGSLEVGKKADLLIINPNKPSTGAVFDPAATLVFACNAYNIESVIVAGEELVKNGDLIKHDTAKINTELRERIKRIQTSAAQAKH